MNDESEILWRMFQEHRTHGRHHEVLRSNATTIIFGITAAVLTVVGFEKQVSRHHWPLGLFLVFVGLYGVVFSAKQYERIAMHASRARKLRAQIDATIPGARLLKIVEEAKSEHASRWKHLSRIKHDWFWTMFHAVIVVAGITLAIVALSRKGTQQGASQRSPSVLYRS
jgi:FtsH-binding integral membrane protein